jgi:hypothetical protein
MYNASGIAPTFLRQPHVEVNSQEPTFWLIQHHGIAIFDTVSNEAEVLVKVRTP